MIKELWVSYPEFPDRYEVSSLGNVRSKSFLKSGTNVHGNFKFFTKQKDLVQFLNSEGYMQLRLMVDGLKCTRKVHRMVASTFLPNLKALPMVNHVNSVRSDNRVENLEWCTAKENAQHSFMVGENSNVGTLHPRATLTNAEVMHIKTLSMEGHRVVDIAVSLGLPYHRVSKILNRVNWKHIEPTGSGWREGILIEGIR